MLAEFLRHIFSQRDACAHNIDKSTVFVKNCSVESMYFVDIFSWFRLDFMYTKC